MLAFSVKVDEGFAIASQTFFENLGCGSRG